MEAEKSKEAVKKVLLVIVGVAFLVAVVSLAFRKFRESSETRESQLSELSEAANYSGHGFDFDYAPNLWLPKIIYSQGVVLANPELKINSSTEAYAFGPHIRVSYEEMGELIRSTSTNEWLEAAEMGSSSDFFISGDMVTVGSRVFYRVERAAAEAEGVVLSYVTFLNGKAFVLSLWPYFDGSKEHKSFLDVTVPSFRVQSEVLFEEDADVVAE